MSEEELNSYRFSSGEDPTDEMLHQIMKDAATAAIERKNKSNAQYRMEMEKERVLLKSRWNDRISRYVND